MIDIPRNLPGEIEVVDKEKIGEFCWDAVFKNVKKSEVDILTMVRSPLAHVYSMWMHCHNNLDNWASNTFSEDDWSHPAKHGIPRKITPWLRYWVKHGDQRREGIPVFMQDFHCYLPKNVQARALSCTSMQRLLPQNTPCLDTTVLSDDDDEFSIDQKVALRHITDPEHGARFVGLTDYYQESMCLLRAKYSGHLPDWCDCQDTENWRAFPHANSTHGSPTHSLSDLSHEDIELMRNLTRVDSKIYSAALTRFKAEITSVEKYFGKTIWCHDASASQRGLARDTSSMADETAAKMFAWDDEL